MNKRASFALVFLAMLMFTIQPVTAWGIIYGSLDVNAVRNETTIAEFKIQNMGDIEKTIEITLTDDIVTFPDGTQEKTVTIPENTQKYLQSIEINPDERDYVAVNVVFTEVAGLSGQMVATVQQYMLTYKINVSDPVIEEPEEHEEPAPIITGTTTQPAQTQTSTITEQEPEPEEQEPTITEQETPEIEQPEIIEEVQETEPVEEKTYTEPIKQSVDVFGLTFTIIFIVIVSVVLYYLYNKTNGKKSTYYNGVIR